MHRIGSSIATAAAAAAVTVAAVTVAAAATVAASAAEAAEAVKNRKCQRPHTKKFPAFFTYSILPSNHGNTNAIVIVPILYGNSNYFWLSVQVECRRNNYQKNYLPS